MRITYTDILCANIYVPIWNDEEWTAERILNLLEDQDKGYLFEVDLHIPEDKHDYFNGYVPCPESLQVKKDNLQRK